MGVEGTLTSQPHPRPDHGLHQTAPSTSTHQPALVRETLQQRSAGSQGHHVKRMLVTDQQPSVGRGMAPHDHNHNTSLGDNDIDELDNRQDGYLFPENFNDVPSYDTVDRKSNSKPTFTPSPPNTLNKSFPNGFPNFNNFRNNPQGFYDNLCYDAGYASERSPEEEDLPVRFDIETLDSSRETTSRETTRTPDGRRDREDEEAQEDQPNQEQSIVLQLLLQGVHITTQTLMDVYPFINEGTMFDVTVEKNSRGLGLSLCGGCETKGPYAGLLRIKKLYPQMPAWLCGQLRLGDIVLEANQLVLSGLASHEALEVLRTTKTSGVHLLVCRPPLGALDDDTCSYSSLPDHSAPFSQDVVSSSMMGVPLASPRHLAPSPVQSICGEFEINLTKVNGSLGFTLRKRDNSVLGHTIRTLVREPALSDGRIKPGDKILSVNNTDLCGLSHEEAIGFLRTTPETVSIRLYRDVTQTPVSPLSPSEPEDSILKPKPLRQEARDMLSDLAFRKRASPSMSPASGASGGHSASPGNPRRRRLQKTPPPDVAKAVVVDRFDSLVRKMEETSEGLVEVEEQDSALPGLLRADREPSPLSNRGSYASSISRESALISRNTSNASNDTNSLSESSEARRKRPNFLDLDNRQSCPRKTQFTPPHEVGGSFPSPLSSSDYQFLSMGSVDSAPPLGSAHSVSPSFAHLQPAYQSVNIGILPHHANDHSRLTGTTSDYAISGYSALDGGNTQTPDQKSGLLKWKGMMMAQEEDDSTSHNSNDSTAEDQPDRLENIDGRRSHRMKEVTISLHRGWNSRLGFSLQAEGGATKVVAIYAGCVAAKDGRLRIGDQVLKVNGEDVTSWQTERVIDLLRKTHGKIDLTVLQQPF